MTRNRWIITFGALWLCSIGTGIGLLVDYSATPGLVGVTPSNWPAQSGLIQDSNQWTVVLAVHPRCPCTRSTIDEFEMILSNAPITPQTLALVFKPSREDEKSSEESFARTQITNRLSKLPGVRIVSDRDSILANQFGALTSGHALVYDPEGELRFSGGLTPTRAHIGPNTGSAALAALFNGEQPPAFQAPVFGCPLCPTSQNEEVCFTEKADS